jgi:hypothetical protein
MNCSVRELFPIPVLFTGSPLRASGGPHHMYNHDLDTGRGKDGRRERRRIATAIHGS